MKPFIDKDFLLYNEYSKELYHKHAKGQPIIDYHNHLSAKDIYERRRYNNLTELWLEGDHYKWRALRAYGIDELYITGDASDYEKFEKWAEVVPKLIGSPLYHWTHLELQRYFNIDTLLMPSTAKEIYNKTQDTLKTDGYDAVSLLQKMNVEVLCTTDDPTDSLEWHIKIAESREYPFKVLPTFRPDRFFSEDKTIKQIAIKELEERFGLEITDMKSLKAGLNKSLDFFQEKGCVISDHGFSEFNYNPDSENGALLYYLGKQYAKRNIVMQIHTGATRNNNTKLFKQLGRDAGGDSVGNTTDAKSLSLFLDNLDKEDNLPKTILYCLNGNDNHMMAALANTFNESGIKGKVQFGSAWWFLDNIRGMEAQLDKLMETNLLGAFVGMLTDSRSFTSFVRHEYFRRILCNKLGNLVEKGLYPEDIETLGKIVEDICYKNAKEYFELQRSSYETKEEL